MKPSMIRLLVILLILAGSGLGQQPNGAQARLTVNNVDGPTYPFTAPVFSPGVNVLELSGEPASPFALLVGTLQPGWLDFGSVGKLDLHSGPGLQVVMDGFAPLTAFDFNARLSATEGTALISAQMPAGLSGNGLAFQAVVADPLSPLGVTLSAACQGQFVSVSTSSSGNGAGITTSGMAGTNGNQLAEVRAPLDAVGTADVTVLGNLNIAVTTTSKLRDGNGNTVALTALQPGDFAKIELIIDAAAGTMRVHELRLEPPFAGYDVKVAAAVDAVGTNDLTLLGVTFDAVVGSDIQFPGGLAAIAVGDFVEVKADLNAGSYEIVELHGTNPLLGVFEVFYKARAAVEAVDANSVTVLGQQVFFGSGARIEDFGSLAGVQVGDFVEVRANPDQSIDLWATRIRSRNPDTPRLDGPVDQILSATEFSIYDTKIVTTTSTQWQNGLNGFADLNPGLRIEVKGNWNGTLITATEIGLEN